MAQYMLSVWHDDEYELNFESDDAQRRVGQVMEFNAALTAANALLFAGGLRPASTSLVMKPEGAEVTESDGPFTSTKAQMGGFWIIEAGDDEAARAWSRQAASACEQPVEMRTLQGQRPYRHLWAACAAWCGWVVEHSVGDVGRIQGYWVRSSQVRRVGSIKWRQLVIGDPHVWKHGTAPRPPGF